MDIPGENGIVGSYDIVRSSVGTLLMDIPGENGIVGSYDIVRSSVRDLIDGYSW